MLTEERRTGIHVETQWSYVMERDMRRLSGRFLTRKGAELHARIIGGVVLDHNLMRVADFRKDVTR
jgi:hypothetical protein